MQLDKKTIKEFRRIYKKEFKEEINDTIAQQMAIRVLNLFRAVYGPLIKNNHESNKKR